MTKSFRQVFYPQPALPPPWSWVSHPHRAACAGCPESIAPDEYGLYREDEQTRWHLGCAIERMVTDGVAAKTGQRRTARPAWEHEQLVDRFFTGSRAEVRVEVTARAGKGYLHYTHRRRQPAGYWEAWQEFTLPLESAGALMAVTARAADQCEQLPGVESAMPATLPAGAPDYALPALDMTRAPLLEALDDWEEDGET